MKENYEPIAEKLRSALDQKENQSGRIMMQGLHTPAAVLVPFVRLEGSWNLLFTKRTDGVATHRGEISFPGGALEPGDLTIWETALRETHEELGIRPENVEILGSMAPIPTISDYCVLPVIGILKRNSKIRLNRDEVEKVIFIPIDWLRGVNNFYTADFYYGNSKKQQVIHYQDYRGDHLWGLTARITQNVLALL